MQRSEGIRRLTRLVPWPTLLLAAACGGGDKGPSGPDGGDGGIDQLTYELVALGRAGLPADALYRRQKEGRYMLYYHRDDAVRAAVRAWNGLARVDRRRCAAVVLAGFMGERGVT